MAATTKAYGNFARHLARGRINWAKTGGSLIKCALMANTYTPDQDAHASWADVKEHEAAGLGYTAGGKPGFRACTEPKLKGKKRPV